LPAPEISIDWWKDISSGGLDFGFSGMGDRIRSWNWEIINTHSHIGKQFNYKFTDTGIYTVVLLAEGNNGCKNTDTVQVPVFYKIVLFIPDAFSPNNDGTNDVFKPEGIFYYLDYKLEIFNGWGAKMFETKNPNEGWNGRNATQDVYVYLISILNTYGEKEVFKGTFHLIR
jgi:gliding motility-associated-like protein